MNNTKNQTNDGNLRKNVAAFIETHRNAKRLTQSQLAEGIGVTRRTVVNWESGDALPKLTDIIKILDFLGEDAETFFAEISGEKEMNEKQEKVVYLVRSVQDENLLDLLYAFIGGLTRTA